ncbi:MAG: thiamine phosphate synthase [Deltaproteobacteria bacterium]|nr:thiamine phosphate synthase [Deltaproteobacteria bacterium]NCP95268.1 thiamine phosphate synthase [Deltaproteobacteria bacterium]NCS74360.1 thiamine phosphate synthase [Deltaproteobacteria bacterium]
MALPLPRVMLITAGDAAGGDGELTPIERAVAQGVGIVQVREKQLADRPLLALARRLRALTQAAGALLLLNGRADLCLLANGDGVHLPAAGLPVAVVRRLLGPGRLIGRSCHTLAEVVAAAAEGADYATFGPLYPTPSKERFGDPPGPAALAAAVAATRLPLFALGGINPAHLAEVAATGCFGVAAIRALYAPGGAEGFAAWFPPAR